VLYKWTEATAHYTQQTANQVTTEAIIYSIKQINQLYDSQQPQQELKSETKSEFSAALLQQAESQLTNATQFIN